MRGGGPSWGPRPHGAGRVLVHAGTSPTLGKVLCAFHAVADGVRPLAMPVRLVTVWTSEQLAEETLPFVAKDASRSIIDPASMLVRPLVETIRRPLPIWTNLPPPSA